MEDPSMIIPVPVKSFRNASSVTIPRSFIPKWLAVIVYAQWVKANGHAVPFEHFQKEGFEAVAILDLIGGGDGSGAALKRNIRSTQTEKSVKGEIEIITPGTRAWADFQREVNDTSNQIRQKKESNTGATGKRLIFGSKGR